MGTYTCRMKGCVGDGTFELSEGEEKWYMEKFGNLPRNCPACRDWKKKQVDVYVTCEYCGFRFRITGQQIVGWHIHNGIWEKPTKCKLCDEDPNRAVREKLNRSADAVVYNFYGRDADHPRQHLLRPVKDNWFRKRAERKIANARRYLERWLAASKDNKDAEESLQQLSRQWTVIPIEVSTDAEVYKNKPDKRHGDAYEHLHRHFRDNRPSGGENESANLDRIGAKRERDVLSKLHEIAINKDPNEIVEFRDARQGYLVKYHFETGSVLIIHDRKRSNLKDKSGELVDKTPPPPPPYVKTSYPKSLAGVATKMRLAGNDGWVPNLMDRI